jgi:osmotically-inducible protein OsmY
MMSDLELRQDILDELEYEPSVDAAHIGATVEKGVVTLSGHVATYAEKIAAVAAARRVKGIRAIVDHIETRYPSVKMTSDDAIAQRAANILEWDTLVPGKSIQVMVHDGFVTLSGNVAWHYQKTSAEDDVRKLVGVRGVVNDIEVRPPSSPQMDDIKAKLENALKRHAEIEANAIRVTVHNSKVVLDGRVNSLSGKLAVENAAWSVPGVRFVEDHLTVL